LVPYRVQPTGLAGAAIGLSESAVDDRTSDLGHAAQSDQTLVVDLVAPEQFVS
jgi:hypothetical protein